jgi:hypothetical protein
MKKRKCNREIPKVMVGRSTAAVMFDTSAGHLANLLSQGRGPRAFHVGRKVLYCIEDLEAFFKSCPVQTRDSLDCS